MKIIEWLRSLIQDVPAELEECEVCREVDCTQSKWEECPRRLEALVALKRRASTANVEVVIERIRPCASCGRRHG